MPDDDNAAGDLELPDLTDLPLDQLAGHPALRRAAERLAEEAGDEPVALFQSAV